MSGRRPKPTAAKVLQGTFRADRANPHEPRPPEKPPKAPAELKGDALKEWKRLVSELQSMRVLTQVDRGIIAVAASAWSEWQAAERAVKHYGMILQGTRKRAERVRNPAVQIRRDARVAYQRALIELGLTPAARTKVKARSKRDEDSGFAFD